MATVEQPITRSELREELRHYASKSDLSQLEVRLAQMETRLTRWMVGMMLGSIVAASSASLVIQRILG